MASLTPDSVTFPTLSLVIQSSLYEATGDLGISLTFDSTINSSVYVVDSALQASNTIYPNIDSPVLTCNPISLTSIFDLNKQAKILWR